MLTVVILGAGNLAYHLFKEISSSTSVQVLQIFNHQPEKLVFFPGVATTTEYTDIKEADFYIISVKDDAIGEVSANLKAKKGIVLHTAGAMPMNLLQKHPDFGVFYPLQSFSKQKDISFKNIPICVEASSKENLLKIKNLAGELSQKVYEISSRQRQILHVAAVFANNFSNYMLTNAAEICQNHHIPFEILKPLIQETFQKIQEVSPKDAQTGPAVRNDKKTMAAHLQYLTSEQKQLYTILSESIKHTHGKKL